jgi:hypothetical protein
MNRKLIVGTALIIVKAVAHTAHVHGQADPRSADAVAVASQAFAAQVLELLNITHMLAR